MHADAAWILLGGGGYTVFREVKMRQTLHIHQYIHVYIYIYTMEVSVWMQGYCLDAGDTT